MGSFCKFCGTKLEDESGICASCAERNKQDSAVKVTAISADGTRSKAVPSVKKYGVIATVLVVAVIVFGIITRVPAYEKPIDYFVTGMAKGDAGILAKAFPEFLIEYWEGVGFYLDDLTEDTDGKDANKISYRIEGKSKLDEDEIEDKEDYIYYLFGEDINISAGYDIDLKLISRRYGETSDFDMELSVYKVNGRWYILDDIL